MSGLERDGPCAIAIPPGLLTGLRLSSQRLEGGLAVGPCLLLRMLWRMMFEEVLQGFLQQPTQAGLSRLADESLRQAHEFWRQLGLDVGLAHGLK